MERFFINENKIKIIEKLKSQINGDFSSGYMNPSPFNKYYNFFTDRIVFKIHFAGEDTVNVFQDELNGRIIYLLRHPIPVSLSRKVLPKLKTYIESNFRRNLSDYEIKYAEKLIDEGNYFKCAILDWCIQNKVIMQQIKKNWIVVTYEQLVLDPLPIIDKLMIDLLLENKDRMIKILSMPSKTVYRKDRKIKHQIMKNKIYSNKISLLEKWKGEINDDKEKELMNILNHFEIDCYKYGDVFPAKKYWVS